MHGEIVRRAEEQAEAQRAEIAAEVASSWREGLSHKDWLFDGQPIRGPVMIARFDNLDWEKARVDLGPSVAGNLGPYWHVPLRETIIDGEVYDEGDTVHRLYPKVLQSKWALLILHACHQVRAAERALFRAIDEKSQ
jgi:hypothetical protein